MMYIIHTHTPYFQLHLVWFYMKAFHTNGFSIFPSIFNFIKRFFDKKKIKIRCCISLVCRTGENALCVTRYRFEEDEFFFFFFLKFGLTSFNYFTYEWYLIIRIRSIQKLVHYVAIITRRPMILNKPNCYQYHTNGLCVVCNLRLSHELQFTRRIQCQNNFNSWVWIYITDQTFFYF